MFAVGTSSDMFFVGRHWCTRCYVRVGLLFVFFFTFMHSGVFFVSDIDLFGCVGLQCLNVVGCFVIAGRFWDVYPLYFLRVSWTPVLPIVPVWTNWFWWAFEWLRVESLLNHRSPVRGFVGVAHAKKIVCIKLIRVFLSTKLLSKHWISEYSSFTGKLFWNEVWCTFRA